MSGPESGPAPPLGGGAGSEEAGGHSSANIIGGGGDRLPPIDFLPRLDALPDDTANKVWNIYTKILDDIPRNVDVDVDLLGRRLLDWSADRPADLDDAAMVQRFYDEHVPLGGNTTGVWSAPTPLGVTTTDLPAFPVDALPDWVRNQVVAVAEFTQTPIDLPAAVALAAAATAIGGKARIRVRGPWIEPLNLFVVVALPPGSRKSAVFKAMTQPLYQAERMLVDEAEPEILEAETLLKITASEAKRKADEAAKAEAAEREKLSGDAVDLAKTIADMMAALIPRPRLFADDITPEAAAALLTEQGGRLGVLSAEGGIFQILAGRYSPGMANLDLFLKGHAGDALRVDRRGSSSLIVDEATLTVGLTVQPEVLGAIADMPGFRGRGLLARILYSLPTNTVGWREVGADPPPPEVVSTYEALMANLAADMYRWGEAYTLGLTPEAGTLLLDAERALEPKLRSGGAYETIVDWASKQIGAVARLAGLLHILEHQGGMAIPIEADTTAAAIAIGEYFTAHAVAAFDFMGADQTVSDARYILDWIIRTGIAEFSRRDAHRGCQKFRKATDLDPSLRVLEDNGYIRCRPDPERGRGRPPAPTYDVNPNLS